jgi:hypothetical protein
MRKYKFVLINTLMLLIILATPVLAQYSIDNVYYGLSGNLDAVEYLKLRVEHELDTINTLGLALIHDGTGLNFEGNWQINFLKRSHYDIGLNFLLPVELEGLKIGKGIGFSGEAIYLNQNRYYWKVTYMLNREEDQWIYEGGITVPLTVNTYLTMGLGNSYWNSNKSFKLGIEVDLD